MIEVIQSIDAEAIQRKVVTQRSFEIMNSPVTSFTCLVQCIIFLNFKLLNFIKNGPTDDGCMHGLGVLISQLFYTEHMLIGSAVFPLQLGLQRYRRGTTSSRLSEWRQSERHYER